MRFLFCNIAYGTGSPRGGYRQMLTGPRYVRTPERVFRHVAALLHRARPELIGLVEADVGSPRTGGVDQIAEIAARTGCTNRISEIKYGPDSLLRRMPYLKHHANALLSKFVWTDLCFDFLPCGTKRLILGGTVDGVQFRLVHLALTRKVRARQLAVLAETLPESGPLILAGDFNTFGGERELEELKAKCRLRNVNLTGTPTYPVWAPDRQLDYVLVSPEIRVLNFRVLPVRASDHLPLLLDFELNAPGATESD